MLREAVHTLGKIMRAVHYVIRTAQRDECPVANSIKIQIQGSRDTGERDSQERCCAPSGPNAFHGG